MLSRLGGTVFLLAHRHGCSSSRLLSLNVKGVKKKGMNPRQRLPRYAEGRRPRIKTVSAQHGAQSSKGSQPTDCTFIRSLEGGVAAAAASSEAVGVCCPPRLQESERRSLPEESLSSPSLEKRRRCAVTGWAPSGAFLQEPACAGGKRPTV